MFGQTHQTPLQKNPQMLDLSREMLPIQHDPNNINKSLSEMSEVLDVLSLPTKVCRILKTTS